MRVLFSMLLLVGFAVSAAEPTQTFTDDLNRKVVVPVHPKRIVSLHDLDITIPLIELGVPPVASHGRTRPDGSHFLRSSGMLTGVLPIDDRNSAAKRDGLRSLRPLRSSADMMGLLAVLMMLLPPLWMASSLKSLKSSSAFFCT